ncbi:MAG: aminotransferase class V-fold PLP-dependent enzyme [Clostridiales bacterium]|nr:aminotransferase class V-fold PLP-dependent enzyme [Clostridiales bacterium]
MIYFDNAATTWPKPPQVRETVARAIERYGANPGRSGHSFSVETAQAVYEARKNVASFFGAEAAECVAFTGNCTQSLNTAINGLARRGCHIITSCLEHNSVMRPLESLRLRGIADYSVAYVYDDDEMTVRSFERLIRRNTLFIVCTAASNVTGKLLPVEKLSRLAREYGLKLVVDAAQAAGVMDINVSADGIDYLCAPGHKGLYGPMGTGVLICSSNDAEPLVRGGTGSDSFSLLQPDYMPDKYESGTVNVPGILGLSSGVDFVRDKGLAKIRAHEADAVDYIRGELEKTPSVTLYGDYTNRGYAPLLSFNINGLYSEETAMKLDAMSIAVRGGFHCAASAHRYCKTEQTGSVRVCPSYFTSKKDVKSLLISIQKIAL